MYSLIGSNQTYVHMWLYILPIWAFWELAAHGYSDRRVGLAIASIVPGVFWTPYYTFHLFLVGGVCLVVALAYLWKRAGWRQAVGVGAVTAIVWEVVFVVYRLIGFSTSATLIPTRTMAEIYNQSASPWMYVLPGKFSWGMTDDPLLVHLVPRTGWTNLYLGLSVLALAAVGVVVVWRARRRVGEALEWRAAAVLGLVVAAACFAFSLPPTFRLGHWKLPTPNYVIAHVEPALRAGQRLVMPLMAGVVVLAALGAWSLLRRLRGRARWAAAGVMLVVLGADLWALPPDDTTRILTYPSMVALAREPKAPVAFFENGSLLPSYPQVPCLLQHEFNKPLINDCGLGRSALLGAIVDNGTPLCEQIAKIRAVGTRYLVTAPHDAGVEACLSEAQATERIVAQDATYRVIMLKPKKEEANGS